MNHKYIARRIVHSSVVPLHLMNTKFINKKVSKYTNKQKDFEHIKYYIYQMKNKELYKKHNV